MNVEEKRFYGPEEWERLKEEIIFKGGAAGEEWEQMADHALRLVQEKWKERETDRPEMEEKHFYRYTRKNGELYDETGNYIKAAAGKPVYLVFESYMGNLLAEAIMAYKQSDFCHVSVALDGSLTNTYSFAADAMLQSELENRQGGFFCGRTGSCRKKENRIRVSCLFLTEKNYRIFLQKLSETAKCWKETQYNYKGLLCYVLGRKEETDPHCMFCSQFVAYLLQQADSLPIAEEPCLISPEHLASLGADSGVYRLYDGKTEFYSKERIEKTVRDILQT